MRARSSAGGSARHGICAIWSARTSVTVLYAQSGAGKSSLLNAGLRPLLPTAGFGQSAVRFVRLGGPVTAPSTIDNIYAYNATITAFPAAEQATHALAGFVELLNTTSRAGPTLLVLDQAEELFTEHSHRWKEREPFVSALGRLAEQNPELRLLISIREDYLAELDSYASLMPHGFSLLSAERLRATSA